MLLTLCRFPKYQTQRLRSFCTLVSTQRPLSTKYNIPVGIDNYEELIHPENYYPVIDKTHLIKEIIHSKQYNLILRPEGWGKSINLSMLKSFFSISNKENPSLEESFLNSKIGKEHNGKLITQYGFKYPVVHLNLEMDCGESPSLMTVFDHFCRSIRKCYQDHTYLLASPCLDAEEKAYFKALSEGKYDELPDENIESILRKALSKLSGMLYKHFDSKCIILIDDYDVPAHYGIIEGFYSEILTAMEEFFSETLSKNPNVYKAVIMGVMPITKAYLFSSLKNLSSSTLINEDFEEAYGFTEYDVKNILRKTSPNAMDKLEERIYLNYKGYYSHAARRKRIYNPAEIFKCIQSDDPYSVLLDKYNKKESDLIYHLYMRSLPSDFVDIGNLIERNSPYVEKNVHWHIIDKQKAHPKRLGLFYNPVKIWSILFYMGYLTLYNKPQRVATHNLCRLQIPNLEMVGMFQHLRARLENERHNLLQEVKESLHQKDLNLFIQRTLKVLHRRVLWNDYPRWIYSRERHYHDFFEIMMFSLNLKDYEVISEEKSGEGRSDIMLIPKENSKYKHAFIFELKYTDEPYRIAKMIGIAMHQVYDRDYIARVKEHKHVKEIVIAGIVGTDKRTLHFTSSVMQI